MPPKFPTDDPDYRILHRNRSRYTHYYFYIRDEVLGPMVMCVGSFLPFQTTYYLNGHHFIAGELQRRGVRFRRDDNAFLWVSDVKALQAAADRLSPDPSACAGRNGAGSGCRPPQKGQRENGWPRCLSSSTSEAVVRWPIRYFTIGQ